jgi:hypothetical protein
MRKAAKALSLLECNFLPLRGKLPCCTTSVQRGRPRLNHAPVFNRSPGCARGSPRSRSRFHRPPGFGITSFTENFLLLAYSAPLIYDAEKAASEAAEKQYGHELQLDKWYKKGSPRKECGATIENPR